MSLNFVFFFPLVVLKMVLNISSVLLGIRIKFEILVLRQLTQEAAFDLLYHFSCFFICSF